MEDGLANSSVGVVLVTTNLFQKRWAQEELDGLYALEEDPRDPKILPVWHNVDAADVRAASPMMASRKAVVSRNPDLVDDAAVSELAAAIITQTASKSPAQYLRGEIMRGLQWRTGPDFLTRSFDFYDENFGDFALLSLSHYPQPMPPGIVGQPAPLIELLRAPMAYDGVVITAIARQIDGSQQVLDVHAPEIGEYGGRAVRLAGHVFQLRSVDFQPFYIAYVHAYGPYHPELTPRVPPELLCWIIGVILAYGAVESTQGQASQAIYIAARSMYSMPPAAVPGRPPQGME
jgi:hypothetical protein